MKTFHYIAGLCALIAMPASALAADALNLTFQRGGTDASSVTVNADMAGVTATLTNVSHSLKATGTTTLCPDVNGSSSPTIVFNFKLSDLPSGWTFNNVGLDIRALNASGGNQQSNDNKKRHFNVSVTSGATSIATYTDLDPAAGITDVRKVWDAQTSATITPSNPYELTITVTKGTTNEGCFFGLEGITLSTVETGGETPTPSEPESKFYNIKWKNNTHSYITEQLDGTLAIGDYNTANRIFWEFIPTDNENCYYIRSVASGKYLGSSNMSPSSNSRIKMSSTPVEYYVGLSAATEGENKNCYWLSSTDCDNYNVETASARCLNKDGASNYIIVWTSGVGNKGSYWTLAETENLYEARPFTPGMNYHVRNSGGLTLTHSLAWVDFDPKADNSLWKFEGTSNKDGGYLIVNALTNEAINNSTRYTIYNTEGANTYHFLAPDGSTLTLGGEENFTFTSARSKYAFSHQIYQMPCGSIGDTWISQVIIGSDFHYPMATKSGNDLVYGTITAKPAKYNLLSRDAATVQPGSEASIHINLNKVPAAEYSLTLFVDWDRDGHFEFSQTLATQQIQDATLAIPADAKLGRTRMRLRLTDNGLTGADDDVSGEILDLLLNVDNNGTEIVAPTVKVNDSTRGTAEWSNGVATATSLGNALFLYWAEGHRISSVNSVYEVSATSTPRVLTAFFTANTDKLNNIDSAILNTVNYNATIVNREGLLTVEGADAQAILLFNTSGQLVKSGVKSLDATGLPAGIYIAKAVTSAGIVSAKLKF